jgi:tetratricopeptide (TPR) repeat protein
MISSLPTASGPISAEVILSLMISSLPTASVLFFYFSVFSKESTVGFFALFILLTFLIKKPKPVDIKKWTLPLLPVFLIGFFLLMKNFHLIGALHERHGDFVVNNPQLPAHETSIWLLSIINQGALFFKYLYLGFVPNPSIISIYTQFPFPHHVLSVELIGALCFILYPATIIFIYQKGLPRVEWLWALLTPWFAFLTEFMLIRYSENFVLYRSYSWFVFLFAIILVLYHYRQKWFLGAFFAYAFVLAIISADRINTFASPLTLWEDAARGLPQNAKSIPGAYRIFADLGYAYLEAGDVNKAKESYMKSVELRPDYGSAHNSLGAIYLDSNESEKAITHFEKAIELDPKSVSALMNASIAYTKIKKYQQALEKLKQVIAINPKHLKAALAFGDLYSEVGHLDNAIMAYKNAAIIDPQSAVAQYNLGRIYNLKKDFIQSEKHYVASIKIHPKLINSHYDLGMIYLRSNKMEQALKMFHNVIKINPKMELAYHNIGIIYMRLNQLKKSRKYFKQILQLNPRHENAKKAIQAIDEELAKR